MGLALREQGLGGLENVSLNCNICAPWCFSEFQLLVQSGRVGRRCAARGGRGFLVPMKTVTESGMRRRCETGREPQVKVVHLACHLCALVFSEFLLLVQCGRHGMDDFDLRFSPCPASPSHPTLGHGLYGHQKATSPPRRASSA